MKAGVKYLGAARVSKLSSVGDVQSFSLNKSSVKSSFSRNAVPSLMCGRCEFNLTQLRAAGFLFRICYRTVKHHVWEQRLKI